MKLKKTVTITFMAGPTEKARQWTLPRWLFHAFFAIGTLCVIGGIGLGFFYAYEARKFVTYRQLVQETHEQKLHLDRYRKELESLEAQLSEVNLLDGQIRQMTSGQPPDSPGSPSAVPSSNATTPSVPAAKDTHAPNPGDVRKMPMETHPDVPPALSGKPRSLSFLGDAFQRDALWSPPLLGWETSPFGRRLSPLGAGEEFHPGVDIAQIEGKTVKAAASGYVLKTGDAPDYGKFILLYHGLGVTSLYAHLGRIDVSTGDKVSRGEDLGAVGMSGLTNGPHLHFEIRYFGVPVDPDSFVSKTEDSNG